MTYSNGELSHHGVKGMKWGVRKSDDSGGGGRVPRKVAKADKKFEKNASATSTWVEVNNGAARRLNNGGISRLNNKPEYKNADFTKDSPLRRKYYKDYSGALTRALNASAKDLGTNASGTRRYAVDVNDDWSFSVRTESIKHSDDVFIIRPKLDARGHIISFPITNGEMAHHGVKGMKWGVRKEQRREERAAKGAELIKAGKARGKKVSAGRTAARGAAEVVGILVAGNIVASRIPNSYLRKGGLVAKIGLAGRQGAVRVSEIRAINAYNDREFVRNG